LRCGRIHSGEEGTLQEYYAAGGTLKQMDKFVAKEIAEIPADP
jgi:hypothetical protein